MVDILVSPQAGMPERHTEENSRLASLQAIIAAIRVRSQAIQTGRGASAASPCGLPMVRVFDPTIKPTEGLSAERDVTKREQRIVSILRERGCLRVLGAVASPTLAAAIAQLFDTHENFTKAIDYLLGEEILLRRQEGALCGVRLLLYGGAGVGKTHFALTLAKLLDLPAEVIGLSSAQAAAFLSGSEQYWSNSQPGLVWKQIIQGAYANPIVVLDEIDKVTDKWGDPLGALYQLLEGHSASIFCDKSIPWLPIDASRVNWVATANDVERLHPAIRSRFFEVEVTSPTEDALRGLLQRLYSDLLSEFSLTDRFARELTPVQFRALSGVSVRDAKRILRAAVGLALRDESKDLVLMTPPQRDVGRQRMGFI